MKIVHCPYCNIQVAIMANGICPACRKDTRVETATISNTDLGTGGKAWGSVQASDASRLGKSHRHGVTLIPRFWMLICTTAGAYFATLSLPFIFLVALIVRSFGSDGISDSLTFGFSLGAGQGLGAGLGAALIVSERRKWSRWVSTTIFASVTAGVAGAVSYRWLMPHFPTNSIQGPFWWDHPASMYSFGVAVCIVNVVYPRRESTMRADQE